MKEGDQSLYVCTGCGNCCRWSGYVRLAAGEAERIATFLDMTVEEFTDTHTQLTDDRRGLSIGEREDGACLLLGDDDSCTIQAVKPQQCIDFPNKWDFPGFEDECPAIKLKLRVSAMNRSRESEN